MLPTAIFSPLLLALFAAPSVALSVPVKVSAKPPYPTRVLANLTVIDTPLVREAQAYARAHSNELTFNHVMRGWLYGVLIVSHDPQLQAEVDPEIHALAAILHDLGWDQTPGSPLISPNRRFEVDGAIAARDFINRHSKKKWDKTRLQKVWDGIALHTQESIYSYKEPDVLIVGRGILMDFSGPDYGITEQEYAAVVKEFPNDGLFAGVNETFTWLCRTKPESTYDTFMQPFGEEFVANYSAKGHRVFDIIQAGRP